MGKRATFGLITAAVALAAGVFTSAALAAAIPASPESGGTVTAYPTFTWQLPAYEEATAIQIATAPDAATDDALTERVTEFDTLKGSQTSWSPSSPLPPGHYWWSVSTWYGSDPNSPHVYGERWSKPIDFTVRPADIERVVVSRSVDGRLTFRIAFAELVALDYVNKVQVAIDADRDPDTGIDGLDYSLDWSGSPALLTAVNGEPEVSHAQSLGFRHASRAVTFSIATAEIGSPARFDFYTFVDQPGHTDIAPVHQFFSESWTYPRDDVAAGQPYPTEEYEDLNDNTLVEGDWSGPATILVIVGGVLALGAVAALAGWSIERYASGGRRPRGRRCKPRGGEWSSGEFFQTLLKVLKACLTALLQNLTSVDSQASAGRRARHSQFGNVT